MRISAADYAGELFNRVMGNQASDGAYFTRPEAASLLARLALDTAVPDADWTDPRTWETNRVVDMACGSGTLLAATLTEMKRRAREQGDGANGKSRNGKNSRWRKPSPGWTSTPSRCNWLPPNLRQATCQCDLSEHGAAPKCPMGAKDDNPNDVQRGVA